MTERHFFLTRVFLLLSFALKINISDKLCKTFLITYLSNFNIGLKVENIKQVACLRVCRLSVIKEM